MSAGMTGSKNTECRLQVYKIKIHRFTSSSSMPLLPPPPPPPPMFRDQAEKACFKRQLYLFLSLLTSSLSVGDQNPFQN
jgi:hypothetical protein